MRAMAPWADDFDTDNDFSVEDLLVEPEQEGIDDDDDQGGGAGSFETYSKGGSDNSSGCLQHKYDPTTELDLFRINTEDVAELEWVSRFVDDSFFEYPPAQSMSAAPASSILSWRHVMVPVKARSKRPRKSFSSSTSNNSSASSTTSSSRSTSLILDEINGRKKRGRKKKKKKKKMKMKMKIQQREIKKCSHCGVEKTPQWRAGPMGTKTLCNACGVRYKSGRLLPEYRPACSPTFVSCVHSNSHRKVLEMRRKKEEEADEQLQLGFC